MSIPSYNRSIAEILGIGDDMRYQNPSPRVSRGGSYYIRPYVERIQEDGSVKRVRERIYLKSTTKREAMIERNEIMAKINKSAYVLQLQMRFGDFLDHYIKEYVDRADNLAASTQAKYHAHIRKHIRPALGHLMMCDITTKQIDALMDAMTKKKLSWATRMDTRNLLCGIFTQAEVWGLWRDKNPAMRASVGRKKSVREKRHMKAEQIKALLAALPFDVRLICLMAFSVTLRVSEVLGLKWKNVDFETGVIKIRERYWRGDTDVVKTERASRDLPLGALAEILRPMQGHPEEHVFSVEIPGWSKRCRDDRDINKHFLRPAAKALKLYYVGFGFHAFRRQAITELAKETDALQAMKAAGQARLSTTELYALLDHERLARAVSAVQGRVM